MFKFIPDVKIKWHQVWVGSIVTALLFEIGKAVIGLYFGKANPGSGYGAAGSIILIMLWVSYSSMIVFYGAEFTHAYAKKTECENVPYQS
jgi:membrane protein